MAKYIDEIGLTKIFSLLKNKYFTKAEAETLTENVNKIFDEGEKGQVLTKTEDSIKWEDSKLKAWKGSLEEYNAITNKDDDTIYFVVGEINVEDSSN